MTLEEAIQHAEEVMVENLEKTKGRNASDPIAINCFECADEHRQLAEWLRELKRLREQTRWIPVSEKLPEESITVIGITKFDDIYKAELYDDCGEKKWCADGNFDVPIVAWMPFPQSYTEIEEDSTYQKELNDVRQELLSRPDQYITFRDLVERFDDVDAEFNHSSWNLLQIYSNFNILIGTESEEEI